MKLFVKYTLRPKILGYVPTLQLRSPMDDKNVCAQKFDPNTCRSTGAVPGVSLPIVLLLVPCDRANVLLKGGPVCVISSGIEIAVLKNAAIVVGGPLPRVSCFGFSVRATLRYGRHLFTPTGNALLSLCH